MKNQEAPPLTGPSEYGTSITITVTPDVLTQDGASQSLVTITARDQNGNPLRNQSLRAEIFVNGERVDFGSLSARNLVTDANGRATLVFTAPPSPAGLAVGTGSDVQIVVTPVGADFGNTFARSASIRLVPPGVVVPADGLEPRFTFAPPSPAVGQDVLFDACNEQLQPPCAPPNNPIATYSWNFGDGSTATGRQPTHEFDAEGVYNVTLTITDFVGRSATFSDQVTVSLPTGTASADFTYSPNSPVRRNTVVRFDASASRPPQDATITRYEWTFGDSGTIFTTSSPVIRHTYTVASNYTVTLRIYDDRGDGLSATTTRSITITP